jgi:hypothetical protein
VLIAHARPWVQLRVILGPRQAADRPWNSSGESKPAHALAIGTSTTCLNHQADLLLLLVQHFQRISLITTMFLQSFIGAALVLAATATAVDQQQPILDGGFEGQQVDLIKEFVSP